MDKIRHYFQQHPVVHWLMTIVITFTLILSGGLFLHQVNWPLLVFFSISIPTAATVMRLLKVV